MPAVQITLLEGRTTEQKRKMARRITDVLVEDGGANPTAVVVTFVEVPRDSYASGGVLICDKQQNPPK